MEPIEPNKREELKNSLFIKQFISDYFDIRRSKEEEAVTIDNIRNGVEFKGTNLWILIFAIFIASLGLNVNSTAVIIGAMLISPLMGPIMGMGLAIGQNDFELMKRSFKSFLVATLISVATSTIYFSLTPLNEVQSELLARTSPTIYDVLIALFGGLAGIVALATKEKGNVLPGVAIATALMPPLCTAGFGLATGNLIYFLGAFYLYFINSVFISLATFLGVRVLGFSRKEFVNDERGKMVRRYIVLITVFTMCPAIYLTYGIVKETFYTSAANKYIHETFNFPDTQIVNRSVSYNDKEIRVVLIGKAISAEVINQAEMALSNYNLKDTKLMVVQGMNQSGMDIGLLKEQVMEDFYKNSEKRLLDQALQIDSLQDLLDLHAAYGEMNSSILSELEVLYPGIKELALAKTKIVSIDSLKQDTLTLVLAKWDQVPTAGEQKKIKQWLKARLGAKQVKLLAE
ncbi:MAG: TIGR00341 family protein [Phocaeicola sp.]